MSWRLYNVGLVADRPVASMNSQASEAAVDVFELRERLVRVAD
jgi:hypothetical protein